MTVDEVVSCVVVSFFDEVVKGLALGPVRVHWTPEVNGDFRGAVSWNDHDQAWDVFATGAAKARGLLWVLFHELGHIAMSGGVPVGMSEGVRDIWDGVETGAAREARSLVMARDARPETRHFEAAADAYAEGMTVLFWDSCAAAIRDAVDEYNSRMGVDDGTKEEE